MKNKTSLIGIGHLKVVYGYWLAMDFAGNLGMQETRMAQRLPRPVPSYYVRTIHGCYHYRVTIVVEYLDSFKDNFSSFLCSVPIGQVGLRQNRPANRPRELHMEILFNPTKVSYHHGNLVPQNQLHWLFNLKFNLCRTWVGHFHGLCGISPWDLYQSLLSSGQQ